MADPTYTLAGLQTEFNALITAVEAGSWSSARVKLVRVRAVLGGLPSSIQTDGATVSMRGQVDDIAKIIADAEREAGQASDNRRIIRTGVSHG